jgi:hypothetical protein
LATGLLVIGLWLLPRRSQSYPRLPSVRRPLTTAVATVARMPRGSAAGAELAFIDSFVKHQ